METINVNNNQFFAHYPKRIPKGTVEAERVLIRLDPEWDGLTVRIHWANQASGKEVVSLLERDKPNSIPWEVLSDLGELRMGLLGLDGETTVKPTIWLSYGYVVEGVDPESGDDPQPPTPSWEQQMVEQATAAAEAAKAAQEAAESAGPYAQAAQASAEAAKVSEGSAAASAQEAGQSKAAAAQAQASAQGHATTAQQAAQEAQAAQESAAQSAQTAATDAQRAETASQEAQDAAARAEAVDAYPRQEANDTFALALKVDTGKGTTHEIYPDPGSNIVVTAYGFTDQEGEGDPSPDNIRPINVGGQPVYIWEFTGEEDYWTERVSESTGIRTFRTNARTERTVLGGVCTDYSGSTGNTMPNDKTVYLAYTSTLLFRDDAYASLDEWKAHLSELYKAGTPLAVYGIPHPTVATAEPDGTYMLVPTDGRSSVLKTRGCKGIAFPITEPLCDGDYVVSNQDEQCVEYHTRAIQSLTGEEGTYDGGPNGLWLATSFNSLGAQFTPKCSHFKGNNDESADSDTPGVTIVNGWIRFNKGCISLFGGKEQLLQYIKDEYVAGTPVTIESKRAIKGYKTYTHAPVPLIAQPDATSKVTVSGEKEVSAVYNKSIKRAIDEINAAILQLGGAQNV